MWLKLEFPLAGEAEKQENRGRGQTQRARETNSSRFTQAKRLLAHLCVVLIPLHTPDPLDGKQTSRWTHKHAHTSREGETGDITQQLQGEITASVCTGPFENECQRGCKISTSHGAARVTTFL